MLTVAQLPPGQLAARLAGAGLYLQTGAFVTRLQSTIPSVVHGVGLMYADYPLGLDDDYADFHLSMVRPLNWRRWLRPQVQLLADGLAPFKPLPLAQAYPMFEWGLNWCISSRAHSYLILHAAVVEKHGRAAILPAPPGSGKSTLCAALVHHGWRLLSDELTMVRLDDGLIVPMPRPISLKNGSIELMRAVLPNARFSPSVHDTNKGTVAHLRAPADSVERLAEPARPAWIVFPRYEAGAAAELLPVAKARAHLRTAENAFNYSVLCARGFDAMADVVEQSDCYDFRYSSLADGIATFERLVAPP
ncbi:HprK-related kinase A [Burkholderia sp. LMU1-1-1.1]|uniref:HprK-related kinase A n=1 Tax=Burkholderia sp. LMU1-1-1.1 TaxID=3135266 RepID=UPI003418CF0D